MTSPEGASDPQPTPGGPVGGAALGLAVFSILLIIARIPFLLLPAVGFAVWAITLGARSLRAGDPRGSVIPAIIGIVLGAIVLAFGLLVLVLKVSLGG